MAAGTNPANEAPSLDQFWMPFTANRHFRKDPRMLVGAEGMYYTADDGHTVLDGTAGLWCVNAGHGRHEIADAVGEQLRTMDFGPTFQMGHPLPFRFAERLSEYLPEGLDRVFFSNSGSESVDTALKIARAYQHARGEPGRWRLIGRERAYHGVNFGGISVGCIVNNRRRFGPLVGGVDHLPHTHDIERNAFSVGLPEHGAERADELERLVALHGAETIAACIVEPVSGSAGVLLPPVGYLERLRELCTKHGILLIFDEVITGFGRLGASFAAEKFGVVPDLMTTAKGITSGTVPMGAVFAASDIHDAFMHGPEHVIELFHGYTYSAHPLACAAALATLDTYREEGLFERAAEIAPYWEEAIHSLADCRNVIDTRNLGLIGAVELEPIPGEPTKRAFSAFLEAYEKGVYIRTTGDIIAMSPPLIIEKSHIDRIVETLREVLTALD